MTRTETFKLSGSLILTSLIIVAVLVAMPAQAASEGKAEQPEFSKRIGYTKHKEFKNGDRQKGDRKERLAHMAEQLGISVEDLKAAQGDSELMAEYREELKEKFAAQHAEKREAKLAEVAEKLGITVEELQAAKDDPELRAQFKEQMMAERDTHLAKIAEERGVTVEELKDLMKNRGDRKHGDRSWNRSDRSDRLQIHPRGNRTQLPPETR